jgi:hypothetical protein
MDYEREDRIALYNALLATGVCPNNRCHRPDLLPVALCKDVYGCPECHETWHLPKAEGKS